MTYLEKMKSGELYDCSASAVPEELDQKLSACKELLYDFNHSRPSEQRYREEIIRKVFAEAGASPTKSYRLINFIFRHSHSHKHIAWRIATRCTSRPI